MSEDPFSDLDDKVGEAMETEPEEDDEETAQTTETTKTTEAPDTANQETGRVDAADTESDEDHDPLSTPAFASGNELNRSLYVRDETWSAFNDAIDIDLRPRLKRTGVSRIAKRELHDAALRVAIENPEAVVEAFLEARGISELE